MPNLFVDIQARFAQFQDSLDRMQRDTSRTAQRMQSAFRGVGAALAAIGVGVGVNALRQSFQEIVNSADEVGKVASRVGLTTEALSGLRHAGSLADVQFEQLRTGLEAFNATLARAQGGAAKSLRVFQALKLDPKQFKDTEQALGAVADRFQRLPDGIAKSALATQLFANTGFVNLLKDGSEGLRTATEEARRLGLVFDTETTRAAEEFNDNLTRVGRAAEGLKVQFIGPLIPIFGDLSQALVDTAFDVSDVNGEFGKLAARREQAIGAFEGFARGLALVADAAVYAKDIFVSFASANALLLLQFKALADVQAQVFSGRSLAEKAQNIREIFRTLVNETSAGVEDIRSRFGRQSFQESADKFFDAQRRTVRVNGEKFVLESEAQAKKVQKIYDDFFATPEGRQSRARAVTAGFEADLSQLGNASKVFKAELDKRLGDVQRFRDAEAQLLSSRNKALDIFYQADLISTQEYFSQKSAAQLESLEKQREIFDREAQLLRDAIARAPTDEERLRLEDKLADVVGKRAQAESQAAQQSLQDWAQQQQAVRQYADRLVDLTARLAEARGETEKAASIRFDVQNRDLQREVESNPAAQKQLEELRKITIAQAQLNDLQAQASVIEESLSQTERRLQLDREAGAVTELEQLKRLGEARGESVSKLREIEAQMRAVAETSGDKRTLQNVDAFKLKIAELGQQTDLVAKKFDGIFKDSFGGFFDSLISGTKSVSEAFEDLAGNIFAQVSKIASQNIAESIFGGAGGGSGASGIGQFFAGLFSANGNVFNGGITAFANGGVVGSPTMFKYASGLGVMGEAGPEAIVPLARGADGKLGVRGGGNVTINNSFPPGTDSRTIDQAALATMRAAQRAMRRNG